MANFGLYNKPYIKMGTSSTVCYCCVKDICETTRGNAHDVTHDQLGKLENKMVFYIRRSGQDTCICLDCFKKLYENIVSAEIETENNVNSRIEEDTITAEVAKDIKADEQKVATKKTSKAK